jgi:hypothetical protein
MLTKSLFVILAFNAGPFAQSDRGRISGRVSNGSGCSYNEFGGGYSERINLDQPERYFGKRLQKPGLTVTVEPAV